MVAGHNTGFTGTSSSSRRSGTPRYRPPALQCACRGAPSPRLSQKRATTLTSTPLLDLTDMFTPFAVPRLVRSHSSSPSLNVRRCDRCTRTPHTESIESAQVGAFLHGARGHTSASFGAHMPLPLRLPMSHSRRGFFRVPFRSRAPPPTSRPPSSPPPRVSPPR